MVLQTFEAAAGEVEVDLDIQGEDVIGQAEMIGYFNAAIRDAESIIQSLYEGYFLDNDYVPLTVGGSSYDMPANCYANKIIKIYYIDGNEKYEVTRIKLDDIADVDASDEYQWNPESPTAGLGTKMVIYPASRVLSSLVMRRWYIRSANQIADTDDIIDIPEFIDFVKMHVRVNCAVKLAHPNLGFFVSERDKLEQRMRSTLKTMVLDGATDVLMDTSFYTDFDEG